MALHTSTKNKSFLNFDCDVEKLLDRELDENVSPILLLNNNLKDKDPYFVVGDVDLRAEVIQECAHNIWYYFREFARLTTKTQFVYNDMDNRYRFTLTEKTYKMIWAYNMGYNFIVCDSQDKDHIYNTLILLLIHYRYFLNKSVSIKGSNNRDYYFSFISQMIIMFDYIRDTKIDNFMDYLSLGDKYQDLKYSIVNGELSIYENIRKTIYKEWTSEDPNNFVFCFEHKNINDVIEEISHMSGYTNRFISFINNPDESVKLDSWILKKAFIDIRDDYKFKFLNNYKTGTFNEKVIRSENKIFII